MEHPRSHARRPEHAVLLECILSLLDWRFVRMKCLVEVTLVAATAVRLGTVLNFLSARTAALTAVQHYQILGWNMALY